MVPQRTPPKTLRRIAHRSRRGRAIGLFGVTLFATDTCLWVFSLLAVSSSFLAVPSSASIPTLSVFILPVLCLGVFFYSIRAYSHQTDMLSLEFTSTYLIGILTALGLSLVAVYFLGTYGDINQPRRLLLPLAFVVFTPAALLARRLMFGRIARLTETKGALLVIGSGEDAVEFYRSYRRMNERHAIRFVDPGAEIDTAFALDGPGSPAVDPHWERRIALVGSRYDAVILARSPSELPPQLTQRLVDIHFHQIPVFTVEAFFEHYWRRVYLRSVSPQWLFQEGFHLTRRSPTSHLKRLIDVVVSALHLCFCFPSCCSLVWRFDWRAAGRRSSGRIASD